jgi:predicted RNase H-like nuclease (RuvC/YqgF family)
MDTEKVPETPEKTNSVTEDKNNEEARVAEIKSRNVAILKLEQDLAAKESEIAALKKELDGLRQALDERDKTIAQAVADYKETVIEANPGLPPELIAGDTIAALKWALKNARAVVDKVRQDMDAAAAKTRIPAGAPQRLAPDLSGLSPREKIQQGLK